MMRASLVLVLLCGACAASSTNQAAPQTGFDAALAKRLGADAYGMKKYVMALLKRGPTKAPDEASANRLFRGHMENIKRLAALGTLVVAGPFLDDGALRGIYIFNVQTVDQARALTQTDPAIRAGTLIMELHPWYGSAGLQQLNALHKRLSEKSF